MSLRSFSVSYRFDGEVKPAALPEWLADSLDERFQGDLGLIQTTRLPIHQTKVRLLAAAIDAVEAEARREIALDEVDSALVEHGLVLCVERHGQAWRDLGLGEAPSFAHAFELYANNPREPAFMQCPLPKPKKDKKGNLRPLDSKDLDVGLKLLPQHGYSIPTQVPALDEAERAFQLMAFAGKLSYTQGWASSSRPMTQAIALDLPGRPSWRFRHEVATTLQWREFWREWGLEGPIAFAWLMEYLPNGATIPRRFQHPLLLDVAMPVRLEREGSFAVFSVTMKTADSFENRSTAALGRKGAWLAGGLPALPISVSKANDLIQEPFGELNRLDEVLAHIEIGHPSREKSRWIGCPTLHALGEDSDVVLPDGVELVIEGEPRGQSKTTTWHDLRIPMPKPEAGGFGPATTWELWINCCRNQLKLAGDLRKMLAARLVDTVCRRMHNRASNAIQGKARQRANRLGSSFLRLFDRYREGEFWRVAARTWNDKAANEREWLAVLNAGIQATAQEAFLALGGFDDPATVMAAARSGLLDLVERRAAAA
jgi:hypothetical protein